MSTVDAKSADKVDKVKKKDEKPAEVSMRKRLPDAKRYIITAAQNATPVHKPFWEALKRAALFYKAELVVIPGRYKNPTSIWTAKNESNEWWDKEVTPHLFDGRQNLNDRIMILGDVKIQWAARSPLAMLDTLTKDKSGIVGHGNRAMRSVATPHRKQPKIMFTTGACTERNYTDTRQGKIAAFNHCLGALIVEIDGDVFYPRQLNAKKDGSFIDLDLEFTSKSVRRAKRALSLMTGDTHHKFVRADVVKATYDDKDSLVNMLRPRNLVWHDLVDQHARNHHHKGDWVTQYAKWKEGMEDLRLEMEAAIRFVNEKTPAGSKSHIIPSNHCAAVDKWLRDKDYDFRHDPVNAKLYLELALAAIESAKKTDGGVTHEDSFIFYAKKFAKKNVHFLKRGHSLRIGGVEHGLHGDLGPNGSRGTTKNLSTIGVKVSKGHNHTAEIIDGCYSGGKCTPPLEYEGGGPSSHSNAHVLEYANGKRAIIFIINGRFCLERPELS